MRRLKRILLFVVVTAEIVIGGCDPGITIYEARGPRKASPVASPSTSVSKSTLVVHVETVHQLAGTSYAPEVELISEGDAPISVTNIELLARKRVHADEGLFHTEAYPLTLGPGKSVTLRVLFHVDEGLMKALFNRQGELRVHYREADKEKIATTVIAGGLEAK